MTSKIKNIIILVVVAVALILAYIFFIKKAPEEASLTSTTNTNVLDKVSLNETSSQDFPITKDFLSVLLNVKNLKLNDAIFSDKAFANLHDSSILLVPDGTEGRPNPFAPLGYENIVAPVVVPVNEPTL